MDTNPASPPYGPRRLTRSRRERVWAGVAGGLAEYFDVDPTLVRLVWVVVAVMTAGLAVLVYFGLAFIMPADDRDWLYPSPTAGNPAEASQAADQPWAQESERTEGLAGAETGEAARYGGRSSGPAEWDDWGGSYGEPRSRRSAGVMLIALGLIVLAGQAGLFRWINWNVIWPAVLIVIGAALLLRRTDWRS